MAARTRSSYIPFGIVSRGTAAVDPLGGASRAVRGYIGEYPEGVEPVSSLGTPAPLLSTQTLDSNGTQRLLDDDIQALDYWTVGEDVFANPDKEYSGFAADGFWYTQGQMDPTHEPFRASWAEEGTGDGSSTRGRLDGFPPRLITVATRREVALFDADTLDVWMRFTLGNVIPAGAGPLAGGPATQVRAVRYCNGFLFIATNEGLRVANFRGDFGMRHTTTGTYVSGTALNAFDGPLSSRNSSTFLDGSVLAGVGALLSNDCLCLGANTVSGGRELLATVAPISARRTLTICAVGHPGGITAMTLGWSPASPGLPRTLQSPCSVLIEGGWAADDDNDLDALTPLLSDSGTNWLSKGVQPGDKVLTDTPSSHTIARVLQVVPGQSLELSPELGVSLAGDDYTISRRITSLWLGRDLSLYIANGAGTVAVNRARDWFTLSDSVGGTALFTDMIFRGGIGKLSPVPGTITSLAKRGDLLLVGTDLGVYTISDSDLDDARTSVLTYATRAQTTYAPEFAILEGDDTQVTALAVDPETGNISVAVTGLESVVTEINPSIQQAFRSFSNVGRVRALIAFRNPLGPPDNAAVV